MIKKIINDKRVTLSCFGVSTIITFMFALLFAESLFYINKDLYAFEDYSFFSETSNSVYSEEDVKEIRKYVQMSDYSISDSNIFTATSDDPYILYKFNKQSINTVKIMLKEPVQESIDVTSYLSSDGAFSDVNAVSSVLKQGEKELILSFPRSELVSVRVDIGSKADVQFHVDKIVIGNDFTDFTSFKSILTLEVIFFVCYFLCNLFLVTRTKE